MPNTRASITPTEVNAIPSFDGNPVVLPLFVEACEDLILTYFNRQNLADPINPFVIKIIKGKFVGEAQNLIASRELATWNDIKACLQLNYSDQRSEDCLLTDLMQINAELNENPYSLGNRIRESLNLLLTKVKLIAQQPERVLKSNLYKKTALQTYLRCLMQYSDYGETIYNRNPPNLETAMSYVLERQNWLYLCKQSSQINTNNSPKFKQIIPGKNLVQSKQHDQQKIIYKPIYLPVPNPMPSTSQSQLNRPIHHYPQNYNQNPNSARNYSVRPQAHKPFISTRPMAMRNPNYQPRPMYPFQRFPIRPTHNNYPQPMEIDPSLSQMRLAPKRPRQDLNNLELNSENVFFDEEQGLYYQYIDPDLITENPTITEVPENDNENLENEETENFTEPASENNPS